MIYRNAVESDLEKIADIEKAVMSCPWSYDNFKEALDSSHCVFITAEESGDIAGYVLLYLSAPEAELPDIVVSDHYRRRGVARGLLNEAVAVVKQRGITDIFLEVREHNAPAKSLYNQFGFVELGIRKNFYTNPVENAICMKLSV